MKTSRRYTVLLNVLALLTALVYQDLCNAEETNALEQRVRRWDVAAIREAADHGRQDLVPTLEEAANASVDPDEPVRIWAKGALAKLGVKKYLDETVAELTTTNSALFAFYVTSGICAVTSEEGRKECATMKTQETAFKKLAYIRNPSTVKVVARFLYSTESFHTAPDVPTWTTSGFAIFTLRQMLDNPPQSDDVKVWQQWWERNKDKYP